MTTLHPTLQEHLQAEIRRAQAQVLRQAAADLINRAEPHRPFGCDRMSAPIFLEVDPADWLEAAVDQIELLARTRPEFTADDLRPLICEPHHPNAWGAAFRVASYRRIITRLDNRPSRTKSRNGGDLKVWAGTEKARTE